MPSLNTPISTTVVALDVPAAGAEAVASFNAAIAAVAQTLGFVTPDGTPMALTLTLAPDRAVDAVLRQLAAAIADFEARCPDLHVRAMLHYGVVFRSETDGQISYLGSAIRSAQSALHRATANAGVMATRDFSAYAAGLPQLPITFAAAGSGEAATVNFTEKPAAPRPASGLSSTDKEFLLFLKRRLAEDVGPFASPLVDNASRNVTSARELAASLSHEIDNPTARRRFETDVLGYIKARSRG